VRADIRSLYRWYFALPIAIVAIGLAIPLLYLCIRALGADPGRTADLVFNRRNLELLWNTLRLAVGVLAGSSLLAFPLAWLTSRTDLPWRSAFSVVGVIPLAVPGYVLAYVLLGLTGDYGALAKALHTRLPTAGGFWGAAAVLSVYLSPYLFLSLRAALLRMDESLEEAGRSLGLSNREVFARVTLPQLRPAYLSGAILIVLHVAGDFGVVSLMRFETFSLAIYLQFAAAFDRTYAAILALILLVLTSLFLWLESRLVRNAVLYRSGAGRPRASRIVPLGAWRPAVAAYCTLFALVATVLPIGALVGWTANAAPAGIGSALFNAFRASGAAALAATLLALPIAYIRVRRPSPLTRTVERIAYLGYAMPPLALALAYIFFALGAFPAVYQTMTLLVFAYTLHFLAEAIGPVRTALYQISPNVEEAARSLGRSPLRAFGTTTLPLLRTGLVVSVAFVFLSALKELPLTVLLSPPGFETLSTNVWGYASEALFGRAAPYALAIVVLSTVFVGVLLRYESAAADSRYLSHE
jgi:iron(III) transport system permease protein